MKKVVLALGSNLLDREKNLRNAQEQIKRNVGDVVVASRIYETESWGFSSFSFLNQALMVQTCLSPEEVLRETQHIERTLGRTEKSGRDENGNPVYHDRIIDIDILLFEGESRSSTALAIPHPMISQREFVLLPLTELFGEQVIRPFSLPFGKMLSNLRNRGL